MRVFTTALFFLLAAALAVFFIQSPSRINNLSRLVLNANQVAGLLAAIQQEIITPLPLRGPTAVTGQPLTAAGILAATNQHRAAASEKPLALNQALNQAAEQKLRDMFNQQYFDHLSPDNIGPADLVEAVNYRYLRVGENLALGNYQGDADLVQAWMDSPDHRANILSRGFTEIGLAAATGQIDGQPTWLAVQTFGLPASVCPQTDESLQQTFADQQAYLDTLANQLTDAKGDLQERQRKIDALVTNLTQLSDTGQEKVAAGNKLIQRGNDLLQQNDRSAASSLHTPGQTLQQAGQALLRQAADNHRQVELLNQEQTKAITAYNQQVTTYNQLNKKLVGLAEQINQQIRQYNNCASQYID